MLHLVDTRACDYNRWDGEKIDEDDDAHDEKSKSKNSFFASLFEAYASGSDAEEEGKRIDDEHDRRIKKIRAKIDKAIVNPAPAIDDEKQDPLRLSDEDNDDKKGEAMKVMNLYLVSR